VNERLPPIGWRLVADQSVRVLDGGRVLAGGSPLRLIRLTEGTTAAFDQLTTGGRPLGRGPGIRRFARRLLDAGIVHPVPNDADAQDEAVGAGVAVVIPVRDDPDGLDVALRSVAMLRPVVDEVVVVDDASADEASIAQVAERHGARVVRLTTNVGPGEARNRGAAVVDAELVAFVDADVEVAPELLATVVAHFGDPAVAAVAPRVTSRSGTSVVERYDLTRSPLDLGPASAPVRPLTRVAYVPSAVLVVRRERFEGCGGFDRSLRFGEDVDLVWRLVEAGERVRYVAEVSAVHRPRRTIAGLARQRFGYGSAAPALHQRHTGLVPPLAVSGWSLTAWVMAGLGHPALGLVVAAGSTAALPAKLATSLRQPWRESLRLAGWGHWMAGRQIAEAMTRSWWPITLVVAMAVPRVRRTAAVALLAPALADWWRERPPLDPFRYVALRVLDDVAYGAGVWASGVRARNLGALVPDLRSWPGKDGAD